MAEAIRPLAVITGASAGIGLEWAKCCARNNYDLIIADSVPDIKNTAAELNNPAIKIEPVQADLSTMEGVDKLYNTIRGRHVAALLSYADYGLSTSFLEEDFAKWKQAIDNSLSGPLYLVQKIARNMAEAKAGLILITGSVREQMPGSYHAVYNGIKAFLDAFVFTLRHELKDSGITVTCLMPGDSESRFLEHAKNLEEESRPKAGDPIELVETGFKEIIKGEGDLLMGWQNLVKTAISSFSSADQASGRAAPEEKQVQEPVNSSQRGVSMTAQQKSSHESQSGAGRAEASRTESERTESGRTEYESRTPSEGRGSYGGGERMPERAYGGSRSYGGRGGGFEEDDEDQYGSSGGRGSRRGYGTWSSGREDYDEDRYAQSERGTGGGGSRRGQGGSYGSRGEGGYGGRGGSSYGRGRGASWERDEYEDDRYTRSGSGYGSRGGRGAGSYGGGRSDEDEDYRSPERGYGRYERQSRGRYEEEDDMYSQERGGLSGRGRSGGRDESRDEGRQGGYGSSYSLSRSDEGRSRSSFGCCGPSYEREGSSPSYGGRGMCGSAGSKSGMGGSGGSCSYESGRYSRSGGEDSGSGSTGGSSASSAGSGGSPGGGMSSGYGTQKKRGSEDEGGSSSSGSEKER